MELSDIGLWGMCMAMCVWVGAAMAWSGAGGGGRRGGGGRLGLSTLCCIVSQAGSCGVGGGAGVVGYGVVAPGRREFFI
jgi:hypothetical protein